MPPDRRAYGHRLYIDSHICGSKIIQYHLPETKQRGFKVALSKPCFELWLLLHHVGVSEVADLVDASAVETKLRATLGEYNKKRLKEKHFPMDKIPAAIRRAEKLDASVTGGDIPDGNSSRVYLLWQAIVDKALPSQLPAPLAGLKT